MGYHHNVFKSCALFNWKITKDSPFLHRPASGLWQQARCLQQHHDWAVRGAVHFWDHHPESAGACSRASIHWRSNPEPSARGTLCQADPERLGAVEEEALSEAPLAWEGRSSEWPHDLHLYPVSIEYSSPLINWADRLEDTDHSGGSSTNH